MKKEIHIDCGFWFAIYTIDRKDKSDNKKVLSYIIPYHKDK